MSITNYVRASLKSNWQVTVPDDWLAACIDWISTENDDQNLAPSDVRQMVYEQWLVSDLRELSSSCLPPGLAGQPKVTLKGSYCLQVDSLVDASQPYYSQLVKVRGKENENVHVTASTQQSQPAWEAKPNRMFVLNMTDGSQDVKGMEYRAIPTLHQDLTPGTKVIVRGEVLCRRGMIMLKPENFSVLGGEFEGLMGENIIESNLQKALEANKVFGDQPRTERKEFAAAPTSATRSLPNARNINNQNQRQWVEPFNNNNSGTRNINNQSQRQRIEPFNNNSNNNSWARNNIIEPFNNNSGTRNNARNKPTPAADWDEEDMVIDSQLASMNQEWDEEFDAMMDDIDEDILASHDAFQRQQTEDRPVVTQQTYQPQKSHQQRLIEDRKKQAQLKLQQSRLRQQELEEEQRRRQEEQVQIQERQRQGIKRQSPESPNPGADREPKSFRMGSSFDDSFGTLEMASFSDTDPETLGSNTALDLDAKPYTYLSKVIEAWPPVTLRVVKVKAYISTLLDKLEHNDGNYWSLKAKINDGSGAIDVTLGNELLTSLIGFSAPECMELRRQARADRAVKVRLTTGVRSCQEKLIQLSAILDLRLDPEQPMPIVIRHHQVTSDDVIALQNRVRK